MNLEELSKLKQGDVVRHEPSGVGYLVTHNVGGVPTVIRSIQLHNGPEWTHVYTPAPVAPPPAPVISLVHMVTELRQLGWTFNEATNDWLAPDRVVNFSHLKSAWENRNKYPVAKSFTSFGEARTALRNAGWKNPYGKTWRSPSGCFFEGAREAYAALIQGDGTCNAS